MKTKSLLGLDKTFQNDEKYLIIIIRNYHFKKGWLRKFFCESNFEAINLLQKVDLNKKWKIMKTFESIYKNG